MAGATEQRLLPREGEVRMRLYGQGLGDCFLLAFPRAGRPEDPCYLVIDCGVAKSTPDKAARIRRVVSDIRVATGGRLDALAITHQHYDHLSGFLDAADEWQALAVGALYLPWTESTAAQGEHGRAGDLRQVLDRAARKALERAVQAGALDAQPGFRAEADFLGVDVGGDALGAAGGGAQAEMDAAMTFVRGLVAPDKVHYLEPGDVLRLPGTEHHAYTLGPPLPALTNAKGKRLIELLADGGEGVMYSYAALGLRVDAGPPGGGRTLALSDDGGLPALASGVLALGTLEREGDEGFSPFASEIRLGWDEAMAAPFFQDHYGEAERGEGGAWRRVNDDWLGGAATLALRAGGYTNNLSLVLAFDLPGSEKMLLFPADAQVGNWLSWHAIEGWKPVGDAAPARPPAAGVDADRKPRSLMEDLLGRVAFYKVGHHGSHNATTQESGLERMTRQDLVAYVPVSVPVAQDLMGYCPMPFYPVLRALQERTKGRVFLPSGEAVGPAPPGTTPEELLAQAGITLAEARLPEKRGKDGAVLEGAVPLYLEVTVR
jgi:glyoxylase-like metal-dependent hydrolase (beta-lactamase superfamily II)